MDLHDTDAVIRAHQRRAEERDAELAHYTALTMAPHLGKKTPKPEKLRRIKPEKHSRDKSGEVHDLDEKRQQKATAAEWSESIRRMPKRVIRRGSGS